MIGGLPFVGYALFYIFFGIWGPEGTFDDSSMESFPFTTIKHFSFMENLHSYLLDFHRILPCIANGFIALFCLIYAIIGSCIGLIVVLTCYAIYIPLATLYVWMILISFLIRIFSAIFTLFIFSSKGPR